jgi:hypothetical protein
MLILHRSRALGHCRSCDAPIEWAKLADSGKAMPFNRPIVLLPVDGTDSPLFDFDCVDMTQTTSHFATCPDAQQWRKRSTKA